MWNRRFVPLSRVSLQTLVIKLALLPTVTASNTCSAALEPAELRTAPRLGKPGGALSRPLRAYLQVHHDHGVRTAGHKTSTFCPGASFARRPASRERLSPVPFSVLQATNTAERQFKNIDPFGLCTCISMHCYNTNINTRCCAPFFTGNNLHTCRGSPSHTVSSSHLHPS